jgi:hypothetical protein
LLALANFMRLSLTKAAQADDRSSETPVTGDMEKCGQK